MRKAGTLATTAAVALGMSLSMASFSSFAGGHCPVKAVTDGPKLNWKLSLWGKRRAFTEGMEYVSEHIKACTGGNFTMKLFYGEQLSKSKENLDGIKLGAFEAATFCAAYHPGKNAPLNVLDLPFLPLADFGVMRKAHDAIYAHPASQKALAQWNAHLYMSNILPQYEYMGRGPVPKAVSDFSGKRLRALGGMGRAAKLIGATPSSMPASETYTALQRGTVDAIGFPYSYTFAAYKLDEIADWVTTNMSLGTVNCPTVFSKSHWDKLPDSYKNLLNELKDGAYAAIEADYKKKDIANEKKWKADPKMQMVQIPEDQMAEFRKVAGKPVWDAWVKENAGKFNSQELLDIVLNAAK